MKTKFLLALLLSASLFSCGDSDSTDPHKTPEPESLYQEEGYLMASISQSTAGFSYYAGYFNTLPSGDVDLTKNRHTVLFQFGQFIKTLFTALL